jgi:hypothetical protein
MAEDFDTLRAVVKKLRDNPFRHGWQQVVAIPNIQLSKVAGGQNETPFSDPVLTVLPPPPDFDMYVKDITYDPIEIEIESEKICGHTFNWPVSVAPVTITMTMRDGIDRQIYKWFHEVTNNIIDTDGTAKHLTEIEFLLEKYDLDAIGTKITPCTDSWYVFPTKLGEISESREDGGNVEFPIVFVQSRTTRPYT